VGAGATEYQIEAGVVEHARSITAPPRGVKPGPAL
jgi:hypothetical protein